MNLLEVNNICKILWQRRDRCEGIENVSFSVPKGEYVAIGRGVWFWKKYTPKHDWCSGHANVGQGND